MQAEVNVKENPDLRQTLQMAEDHPQKTSEHFAELHPSELAELLLSCKDDEREILIPLIPDSQMGDTLLGLPESMQQYILADLQLAEIEDIVEHLDSDDAADILQAANKHVANAIIQRLEPEDRRELEPLMQHAEESAGGLMQAELFKVRHGWKVEKVLKVLKRFGKTIENINYVYVVDNEDRLVGVVPLYQLLFAESDDPVEAYLEPDFPNVHAGEDQEKVAALFKRYDLIAIPVVDEQQVLIGRITADDIFDVIHEEATEDMFRLASLSEDDDLAESVRITAWRRGVWLAVNLGTAILASFVIAQFEATIEKIVALAVLMPVVASMGGIAGTQTLTVIVRGIALGRITMKNAWRTLVKEVSVGAMTGMTFAVVIAVIASNWFPELGIKLGLVIAAAMLINLVAAGLAGALIPLTLQRLKIDPALASGTILTTVTDVVGFLSFLGLSTLFLL
ncbi:MAG: magnesium transporter [Zetaproteobacteria bacterium CG02_land_8_20_14_3_00_50_9]|nr:MAG: magnesium transporter [Zetaproteobacteria bacterium CG17_big_fil_post_rev_8_21_14_2_50_50_13]PIV29593.1 MAG: magnesium transporter [Zetaproteobacteria bacterium CG02_land_8_20_14_3_00_50_9]PIY56484.1 MAG: magnesium transporter [Zetaproteobacteria bacterium CG_4_10_14_0_8_um_filter_49_80]